MEVLCVIIIIGVLSMIVVPVVLNSINNGRDNVYDSVINKILNASTDWAAENAKLLPDEGENIKITLGTLQSNDYISTDLRNPKSKRLFPADMIVNIEYVKASRNNKKEKYGKYDGDYLFVVDVDSGTKINEIKDEYTIIEIGATENEVDEIIYQDKDGNLLTLKDVNIQIVNNDNNVNSIDTSKLGIYYIYYTYNDTNETFTRVFNVTDTTLPDIVFNEDETVSTSVSSYDLYSSVTCKDNSNVCNLKIVEGEEEFYEALSNQELGNYVVSYEAIDLVGNTVVKKRVIEIVE